MDEHLEKMRRNLELLSKKDEYQSVGVKEEVEEQDEKAPVSSEISMKNEVMEVYEPRISYPQRPLEMTKEHENLQLPQIFLNQRLSTLESVIERYEEEMKKSCEEQQTSSIKVLLNQMLSAKEEVEEHGKEAPIPNETSMEKEVVEKLIEVIEEHETSTPKDSMKYHVKEGKEANQGSSYSIEAESYIVERLIEPPMQEAFDEDNTPTNTQHLSLDIQEVKATNKSNEKRIVTDVRKITD
ncbi:hypothetical protein AHAS_Ahas06G0201800 [Arachis hypogaea]